MQISTRAVPTTPLRKRTKFPFVQDKFTERDADRPKMVVKFIGKPNMEVEHLKDFLAFLTDKPIAHYSPGQRPDGSASVCIFPEGIEERNDVRERVIAYRDQNISSLDFTGFFD